MKSRHRDALIVSGSAITIGVAMLVSGITGYSAIPKTASILGVAYAMVGAWGIGLYMGHRGGQR